MTTKTLIGILLTMLFMGVIIVSDIRIKKRCNIFDDDFLTIGNKSSNIK